MSFTFSDKVERFGANHATTAKNKGCCKTCREKNTDEYQKADRLRNKYTLMEFKVKKVKPSSPIFYLVYFFCVLTIWAIIASNSSTKAIFFTFCCQWENLYFSLFVVYKKIFSWVFIWLTWIVALLLTGGRKVTRY